MIKVIIELELVFPYNQSMGTLVEFCCVWQSLMLSAGTNKAKAIISMPSVHFKKMFGQNPRKKVYPVPSGAESFIESVKVKDILAK